MLLVPEPKEITKKSKKHRPRKWFPGLEFRQKLVNVVQRARTDLISLVPEPTSWLQSQKNKSPNALPYFSLILVVLNVVWNCQTEFFYFFWPWQFFTTLWFCWMHRFSVGFLVVFGRCWSVLGRFWSVVGRFGSVFGRFLVVFGRFWSVSVGFGQCWSIFGRFRSVVARFRSVVGGGQIPRKIIRNRSAELWRNCRAKCCVKLSNRVLYFFGPRQFSKKYSNFNVPKHALL